MEKITKRQEDVLNYIKKYVVKHGFPPSTREIGAALGLSSPATVHTHLKKLEDAGCIRKTNSKFRTIEIVGENEFAEKIEMLGIYTGTLKPTEILKTKSPFVMMYTVKTSEPDFWYGGYYEKYFSHYIYDIIKNPDGTISIDATMCNGCGLCAGICKFDAIEQVEV